MGLWIARTETDRARACRFMLDAGMRITDRNYVQAIGVQRDGFLRAVTTYTDFLGRTCQMQIAAAPNAGANWCTRRFLWAVFDYPFRRAGCVEALAWVEQSNTRMQSILCRLGFAMRYAVPHGAKANQELRLYSLRAKDVPNIEEVPREKRIASTTAA